MNQPVACGECGQIHRYQAIAPGKTALCQRCSAVLYRNRPAMLDASLALAVTGLILFVLTNTFPLLGLRAQGMLQEFSLWQASLSFWEQDYRALAVLLALNIIVFPLFELCTLLWVMLTIRFRWQPDLAIWLFRWMQELKPWGMLEVFMLGVLVAVVKLGDLATLIIGPAFWSFAFLIICMAAAAATLDPFTVWNRLAGCAHDE
ncbi:MAG: paraquat-inducible protein A [Thiolinea sp.]